MAAITPHLLTRRAVLQYGAALAVPALAGVGPAGSSPALAHGATPAATRDAAIPDLVAGNTAFALDLYAELRQAADGNLLVSPYSASLALAMAGTGARGDTQAQMAAVLHLALEDSALHEDFGALTADLVVRGNAEGDSEEGVDVRILRIANALWGEQSYPFSTTYTALLEQDYGAGLQLADFINTPEDARAEINGWIGDQTEGRIQDIVPEGAITELTRLVVANAIYFAGAWLSPFGAGATVDDDFFLLDGSTVTVPLMFQHEDLRYARLEGMQLVELDYALDYAGEWGQPSGFALIIILPDKGQFEQVETNLDAAMLEAAIGNLAWAELLLYLPRFTFEFEVSLPAVLQALGMTDAFDPGRADFSGMVQGVPPEPPLIIDAVLQKTFIAVDEEGTEAAAATLIMSVPGAAPNPPTPPPPIEVRVDRPFLFAIRDTETGTVLFLGRVMDPST